MHKGGRHTEENIIPQTKDVLALKEIYESLLHNVSRVESENDSFRTRLENWSEDLKENGWKINKNVKSQHHI